jgi:hypothetical protein
MSLDDIADAVIDWAVNDARVKALWIEADALSDLRRPYRALRLHLSADEPVYPALLRELGSGLACVPGSKVASVADTERFARDLSFEAQGLAFSLIAEQSHLLAKRPRAEVIPLVDKTGHLTHVMDFSRRKRR